MSDQAAPTATRSRRLSLDEVFHRTCGHPNRSPAKQKIVLTPLSKKACLVHGIDPSALQQRDFASFGEDGLDPEIQTMRFEVYSHTREKLMQIASNERSKLAAKANDSMSTADSANSGSKLSFLDEEQNTATLVELEKRRLEKVARRQQKELLRMLAFESKSQAINDKMKKRAEEQAQKELERKKEKRKRDQQAAEDARIRELRRRAKEEMEASLQRLQMQQQFERDKKIQQEKTKQEKEQKRRLRMEERQRAKKAQKHRQQTKQIFEQQRKEIEHKMKERNEKERAREEKLELKRLVDAQVAEVKRKEAADRIDANLTAARTREEEKRSILMDKQAKHDDLMSKIKEEKMTEIQLQKERNSAMERKRKHLLTVARNKEEALKQSVKNKIGEEEARLEMQQKEAQKELELRRAEKDILMEMKQDNLARIKRMQEYQQKETLRKVAMNDARSEEMKKKKAELLALRRKNAHEAKIKKDKLMAVLEQARGSGGSSTAVKKLLRKMSTNEDLIVSAKPRSRSLKSDSDTVVTEMSDIGPPPDAPSYSRHFQEEEESLAQPYKSPYATVFAMDDLQGLKNLRLNDSSDNKSL